MNTIHARTINSRTASARLATMLALLTVLALGGCDDNPLDAEHSANINPTGLAEASGQSFPVSGTVIFNPDEAIVHSVVPTEDGLIIQRNSNTIESRGDLSGYIVSNATLVINPVDGTFVATGTEHFSGTVAGSGPVTLFTDDWEFDETDTGFVNWGRSKDARSRSWFECTTHVVYNDVTPEGDLLGDYTGECTRRGRPQDADVQGKEPSLANM